MKGARKRPTLSVYIRLASPNSVTRRSLSSSSSGMDSAGILPALTLTSLTVALRKVATIWSSRKRWLESVTWSRKKKGSDVTPSIKVPAYWQILKKSRFTSLAMRSWSKRLWKPIRGRIPRRLPAMTMMTTTLRETQRNSSLGHSKRKTTLPNLWMIRPGPKSEMIHRLPVKMKR